MNRVLEPLGKMGLEILKILTWRPMPLAGQGTKTT